MFLKKKLTLKMVILALLSLLLFSVAVGCGSGTADKGQAAADKKEPAAQNAGNNAQNSGDNFKLVIAMGTPGGTWQSITEGIAQAIRQEYPKATVEVVTGSIAGNVLSVQQKKVDMAIVYADSVKEALDGIAPYDKPNPDVRGLFSVYQGVMHYLVPKNSPINSFKDIVAQKYPLKMSLNTKGSTPQILTEAVLNEYGITQESNKKLGGNLQYTSSKDAFPLMQEGRFNMALNQSYVPATAVMELATGFDVKLLPLDEEVINKLNEKYGSVRAVITPKDYKFVDKDIPTIATAVMFVAHKDMPEDLAYKVVKALNNQQSYLTNVHGSFKNFTVENMLKDMGKLPVHPGAEKFYQEKGVK